MSNSGTGREQIGTASRGVLRGGALGVLVGGAVGLGIGALTSGGFDAVAWVGALAGAILIGGIAAFWGGMSRLQAPPPADDPSTGRQDDQVPGA